jgi:hypothetical protein
MNGCLCKSGMAWPESCTAAFFFSCEVLGGAAPVNFIRDHAFGPHSRCLHM